MVFPFYRCASEDSLAPVFMSAWCFLSKIPHLLGLSPTHVDCEIAGGAVGPAGVCHTGRRMLQGNVAQLHTTRQPDHHLALVALKSPAIPREHIRLQSDRTVGRSESADRATLPFSSLTMGSQWQRSQLDFVFRLAQSSTSSPSTCLDRSFPLPLARFLSGRSFRHAGPGLQPGPLQGPAPIPAQLGPTSRELSGSFPSVPPPVPGRDPGSRPTSRITMGGRAKFQKLKRFQK